jgi:hypothetical protein
VRFGYQGSTHAAPGTYQNRTASAPSSVQLLSSARQEEQVPADNEHVHEIGHPHGREILTVAAPRGDQNGDAFCNEHACAGISTRTHQHTHRRISLNKPAAQARHGAGEIEDLQAHEASKFTHRRLHSDHARSGLSWQQARGCSSAQLQDGQTDLLRPSLCATGFSRSAGLLCLRRRHPRHEYVSEAVPVRELLGCEMPVYADELPQYRDRHGGHARRCVFTVQAQLFA